MMSPNEEALKIVERFYNEIDHSTDFDDAKNIRTVPFEDAKKCAILHCNQMDIEITYIKSRSTFTDILQKRLDFLTEVKNEINKL